MHIPKTKGVAIVRTATLPPKTRAINDILSDFDAGLNLFDPEPHDGRRKPRVHVSCEAIVKIEGALTALATIFPSLNSEERIDVISKIHGGFGCFETAWTDAHCHHEDHSGFHSLIDALIPLRGLYVIPSVDYDDHHEYDLANALLNSLADDDGYIYPRSEAEIYGPDCNWSFGMPIDGTGIRVEISWSELPYLAFDDGEMYICAPSLISSNETVVRFDNHTLYLSDLRFAVQEGETPVFVDAKVNKVDGRLRVWVDLSSVKLPYDNS